MKRVAWPGRNSSRNVQRQNATTGRSFKERVYREEKPPFFYQRRSNLCGRDERKGPVSDGLQEKRRRREARECGKGKIRTCTKSEARGFQRFQGQEGGVEKPLSNAKRIHKKVSEKGGSPASLFRMPFRKDSASG